jgi:D-2-hydroxyacid dehydrogenase (NADP+)
MHCQALWCPCVGYVLEQHIASHLDTGRRHEGLIYFAHRMQAQDLKTFMNAVDEEVIAGPLRVDGQWAAALREAEIIVCPGSEISEDLVDHCANARWYHSVSAGVDKVPFRLLEQRGILLSNSRGIHAKSIAEQALGMMISFTRGLHINLLNQREHRWEREYPLTELTDQTLCIVGSGTIGLEVARKAKAFDMRVIGVKRTPLPLPNHDEVVEFSELHQVLEVSDFVMALTPLTAETYHLFDAAAFRSMKSTAVFLNFARGDVVDEKALIAALQSRTIAGAALDVFHEEPLPADSPLWTMNNVLISPHNGGWTPHHDKRLIPIILENYRAYREGKPLPTAVNLKKGY